jgi:predicted nucleic acid-binding protein
MILYLDTSALVKRYFAEPYTDEILLLWRQATGIITSAFCPLISDPI